MLLYVMRHGPAEDRAATGRDVDRALTPEGRAVVAGVAHRLHASRSALGGRPWRVLSSPYRRAFETARIVSATASPSIEVEAHDELGADADLPHSLVRVLTAAGADALLVGHQPTVEVLVRELAHPAAVPLPGGFRTATVVALEHVPGLGGTPVGGFRLIEVVQPHVP